MSVKRIIMDERIVRAAQSAGAELVEQEAIDKVAFDEPSAGLGPLIQAARASARKDARPGGWGPFEARSLTGHR